MAAVNRSSDDASAFSSSSSAAGSSDVAGAVPKLSKFDEMLKASKDKGSKNSPRTDKDSSSSSSSSSLAAAAAKEAAKGRTGPLVRGPRRSSLDRREVLHGDLADVHREGAMELA